MSDYESEWDRAIQIIKNIGAGHYGTKHFMCRKHEQWKMLWADERIKELEAENKRLMQTNLIPTHRAAVLFAENAKLREALKDAIDGYEESAGYKGDYLFNKHGDAEEIARLKAALEAGNDK